jgi:hypothetical protein
MLLLEVVVPAVRLLRVMVLRMGHNRPAIGMRGMRRQHLHRAAAAAAHVRVRSALMMVVGVLLLVVVARRHWHHVEVRVVVAHRRRLMVVVMVLLVLRRDRAMQLRVVVAVSPGVGRLLRLLRLVVARNDGRDGAL